jgi:hypothetical protein
MNRFRTAAGRVPRWAWLAAAFLLVGGIAWACWGHRPSGPVDRGFRCVRPADLAGAWTQAEVEAVLGPPGWYATRKPAYSCTLPADPSLAGPGPWPATQRVEWADDYALLAVYFGPDGRRVFWMGHMANPDTRTAVERLRDRIRELLR